MKLVKGIELSGEEYVVIRKLLGKLSTDDVLELGLSERDDTLLEKLYNELHELEYDYVGEVG
jgi:hypothetical protein